LEQSKNEIQEKLKDLLDVIPFALAGEVVAGVSEQLNNERILSEQKFRQDDVNEKIDQIRQDIESERQKTSLIIDNVKIRDFYEDQIKRLVRKYFYSDIQDVPENIRPLHDFSGAETNEFNQLVSTIKHSFKDSFSSMNTEYSSVKNQLDSIIRKIRDAEKSAEDEYISTLREGKDRLDKRILSIGNEIEIIMVKIGELGNLVKTHKQRQEILRKKIDESSVYSEKEQKTKQLINKLQSFIGLFKEEKKKSLGEKMLNSLNILLHKKNFIKKVDVDISITGDDIDIVLYNGNGIVLDKSSLSMGERQMYASALLSSLVDESEIEFPVFIDSPMQKFDEQHAENIIKHFYPNVSKQVIIFPLINKELTEKEYEVLQPKVCKAFLINNTSTDSSEFLVTTPDSFITTYNELYNAN
jgi:DNA sulfur modification protein DndD